MDQEEVKVVDTTEQTVVQGNEEKASMNQNTQSSVLPNNINIVNQNNVPAEYKPIGAWGYVGYNLLFSLPLVGFILILVFSFGGASNINLKNYARSFLIVYLLIFLIAVVVIALLVMFAAASGATVN